MISIKIVLLENKELTDSGAGWGDTQTEGPQIVGKSNDVAENKGRKKFIRCKSNDVDENKGVDYF